MSYPPRRYHGETGRASATLRRASTPPDLVTGPGADAHYLATGTLTNGEFGLYRWNMGPSPSGPGPHFHRTMSESFFVIAGRIKLYDGNDWIDAGPGDFLYVPVGGLHGFRNESGEPAAMLILFAPGAPREDYFEGLVEIGRSEVKPTEAEMAEFYAHHDNLWVE